MLWAQVWDIRNNRCLQTMTDKQKHRPEDALTCLLYDAKQQRLLSGSVLPKVVGTDTATHTSVAFSHQHYIFASQML